jgi:uncharacterized membrane protein YdjX (TVP38/TMEM64 family)
MKDKLGSEKNLEGKKILFCLFLFLFLCLLLWHVPPFNKYTDPDSLKKLFSDLQSSPYLVPIILGSFIVAGITMFPITVLTTAIALFLGIEKGFILSIIGCILSAAFTFMVIRLMGQKAKQYLLSKKKIKKINKLITEEGITSIMILRMVPIGYTIVSVTAALSDINFTKYMIGSIIGVLPDLILCIFLAGSIHNIIMSGDTRYIIAIVVVSIVFICLWSILIKKFISRFKNIKWN